MRILLLCTDAYGGHGGIALFNRELCSALALLPDCEEIVVIPRIVPNVPDGIPPSVTFIAEAAKNQAAYARAILHAKGAVHDLVICGHVNLLPVACAVDQHPVLVVHGLEAWKPFPNRISQRLLHRCRTVVSVSTVTRDRLVGWSGYSGTTHVLPNAVHLEQYGIRPRRPDLVEKYRLERKRVLLTVGRLESKERRKGFDEVLEILPELASDVVYLIAGGGQDLPRLQQKAHDLGVADRVRFTGLFPDEEKQDLYSLADVYVMPSAGEGFGFVLLEAMASGVPVIASKLDGAREAVQGGRLGILVDPTNLEEVRMAISEQLAASPERRRPDGLEYFAFERFTRRLRAAIRA